MPTDLPPLKDLFLAALAIPAADRSTWLRKTCGQDMELLRRVEQMLAAHQNPQSLLDRLAPDTQPPGESVTAFEDPVSEHPTTVIGPYKLLQPIGEGGMGTVFMAQQSQPIRRLVALKLIKPGMDSRQVIARFEAERQALALMDHPNIARVLDAGTTTEGRPYFVMELVKGVPITRYCDENRLTPRQRLELFIPVCQAVQHAHQKGIIHRDLKPGNVLVAPYDGKPVPKVIDFGVAKAMGQQLTEHTLVTGFGAIVGTLEYMSPEQAELNQLDIDTRSDIYALGVMLYELLTGTTPLDRKRLTRAAFTEMLRMIRDVEPPKPSTRLSESKDSLPSISVQRQMEPAKLTKLVRGELDWIVMKALEKDRSRRYETANGFAMDIQRYLDDEPVQACPPSAAYRLHKFARRNKVAFAIGAAVATALLLAVVGLTVSNALVRRESEAKELALQQKSRALGEKEVALREREEALQVARVQEGLARKHASAADEQRKAATTNADLAEKARQEAARNETEARAQERLARRRFYAAQMNLAQQAWEAGNPVRVLDLLEDQRPRFDEEDMRTFEWYYLWRLCHGRRLFDLRLGSVPYVLFASGDPRSVMRNPEITSIAVSPDGKTLASAGFGMSVTIWDLATRSELVRLRDPGPWLACWVAFSHDGKTLAVGAKRETIKLYDVGTWREKAAFDVGTLSVDSLALSPDGKTMAAGTGIEDRVKLWDLTTGRVRATLLGHDRPVQSVAFSPDGRSLASASGWGRPKAQLWDLTTESPRVTHQWEAAGPVAFLPDGKTLAFANGGHVGLRDVTTGQQKGDLETPGWVSSLSIPSDGKTLAIGSADRTVRLWEPATGWQTAMAHVRPVTSVVFMPDGKMVASASQDRITLWDADREHLQITDQGEAIADARSTIAYSPDGHFFAYASTGGIVKLCDPVTGHERARFHAQGDDILEMTYSRDSKCLAVRRTGCAKFWDMTTMQELGTITEGVQGCTAMALAPDGRTVAFGSAPPLTYLAVWDVAPQRLRGRIEHVWPFCAAAYTPDARSLVAADHDGHIQFWNAKTLAKERGFTAPTGNSWYIALAFSPDGKILVVSGLNAWLASFDAGTGRLLARFKGLTPSIASVGVFPDGRTLVSGDDHGSVRLWELSTGQERFAIVAQGKGVRSVAVAPDGKTLATVYHDGTVKLWRAARDEDASARKAELDVDDPESPVALMNEGRGHARSRRFEAAAEAYGKAEARLSKLAAAFPGDPDYRAAWAEGLMDLAQQQMLLSDRLEDAKKHLRQGITIAEKLIEDFPERPRYRERSATVHNSSAWLLATCPEPKLRDPGRAVELARRAVELAPQEGNYWNTLGVIRYRAGDWKAAIMALEKSIALRKGGDSFDWFFLAMANWQLCDKTAARQWYDKAVLWMEKNQPKDEELVRFRAEAEHLLELKK